jgi:hypothetical protein
MQSSRPRFRIRYTGPRTSAPAMGWFGKIVAFAAAGVLVTVTLVFSVVLFAALLAFGLIAGGYIWWKTRALRKQMRAQFEAMQAGSPVKQEAGDVIEGEFKRAPPAPGNEQR